MKRTRRPLPAFFAGLSIVSLAALVLAVACSNQGEGERCEVQNGNEDCGSGLVCVPANPTNLAGSSASEFGYTTVNPPYDDADRCCPTNRASAKHPACTVVGNTGGDAAPSIDATTPTVDASQQDAAQTADADADADIADGDISDAPEGG